MNSILIAATLGLWVASSAAVSSPIAESRHSLDMPAGTEIVVRTVDAIDSRNATVNQTFAALLETSVTTADGRVLVPRNARAQLIIRRLSTGGETGTPEMTLDIRSITVDGRRYLVSTADLVEESEDVGIGKNRRTAETVGGGAALGTIIGAIAGGGKGAAIGAVVGAAGGAGVQVLTRGHDVQVPAETMLTFRLDKPVAFQAEQ